jgi:hypothetical protein
MLVIFVGIENRKQVESFFQQENSADFLRGVLSDTVIHQLRQNFFPKKCLHT